MKKKRTDPPAPRYPISIEIGGQKFEATYFVEDGWVTVFNGLDSKKARLGGSPAHGLARLLLAELRQEVSNL